MTTPSIQYNTIQLFDDEIRRVCKNPGDPWGCTRQHSQRSGLLLPSPWFKHWSVSSSWLCLLMSSTFPVFHLFKSFTANPVTLLMSIHLIRGLPFFLAPAVIPSIISFSKDWCALITCPKYRIFSIFLMDSNEMFGVTLAKFLRLFPFRCIWSAAHAPKLASKTRYMVD